MKLINLINLVSELYCFTHVKITSIEGKKKNINLTTDSKLLNGSVCFCYLIFNDHLNSVYLLYSCLLFIYLLFYIFSISMTTLQTLSTDKDPLGCHSKLQKQSSKFCFFVKYLFPKTRMNLQAKYTLNLSVNDFYMSVFYMCVFTCVLQLTDAS